jgi:hypothetical protein
MSNSIKEFTTYKQPQRNTKIPHLPPSYPPTLLDPSEIAVEISQPLVCHGRLATVLLGSPFSSVLPDPLAVEENWDTDQTKDCSDPSIGTERAIVSGSLNESGHTVAGAETDKSTKSSDDHEDRTCASRVRIQQVCDASNVGTDEAEVVATKGKDDSEPVILLGVRSSKTIKDSRDDGHDDRDPQKQETGLRLVDTAVALRTPFDDVIGAVTQ